MTDEEGASGTEPGPVGPFQQDTQPTKPDQRAEPEPAKPQAAPPGQETVRTEPDRPAGPNPTAPEGDTEPEAEPTEPATEPTELATEPIGPDQPPAPAPTPPLPPPPAVETTRGLLGASFDLLTRSSDDMRRASFYIGVVVLGSVGPFAMARWALEVVSTHKSDLEIDLLMDSRGGDWFELLAWLAAIGLLVAAVESRAIASAILGGRLVGRPLTVRQSLARSRSVFWRVIVGSIIVGIPVLIVQASLYELSERAVGHPTDASLVPAAFAAALVGAPLAYLLSGIVLGDVDPLDATRRSFRVFRARKLAAALVAVFETIATLLVIIGLSAGLEVGATVFGALGLGSDSEPAGLAIVTIGVIVGVFALGTLVYTAFAIAVAPQVVMFVGLTHATLGLDHVRPGGDRDPATVQVGRRRFRWLTAPLLLGYVLGALGLVAFLSILAD